MPAVISSDRGLCLWSVNWVGQGDGLSGPAFQRLESPDGQKPEGEIVAPIGGAAAFFQPSLVGVGGVLGMQPRGQRRIDEGDDKKWQ